MIKKTVPKRSIRTKTVEKKSGSDFQISFPDVISLLRRRAWLLALAMFIGIGLGVAYFKLSANKFASESEILVERRDPTIATDGVSSSSGTEMSKNLMATHMRMVQSRKIIEGALSRIDETTTTRLMDLPSLNVRIEDGITPVDIVSENLFVTTEDQNANTIKIRFEHSIPEESQKILTAIVDEYRNFLKEKYSRDSGETIELIGQARIELEKELTDLDDEYRKFREEAPILSTSENTSNVFESRYEELQTEISSVDYKIADTETRLELVRGSLKRMEEEGKDDLEKLTLIDAENANRMSILVTVDQGAGPTADFLAAQPTRVAEATLEYSELLASKAKLSNLESFLGAEHPDVKALSNQIKLAEEFIKARADTRPDIETRPLLTPDNVMRAYVTLIENDLTALRHRREVLVKMATETESQVKSLVEYELTGEYLMGERQRKQDLYNSIISTLQTMNLSNSAGTGFIHEVLQQPQIGRPVSKTLAAAAIVIFTSLLFGVGFIFLAELADRGVHKPQDLEQIFGTKILSHLPELYAEKEVNERIKAVQATGTALDRSLVTQLVPQSRISEAFRGLRTQVMFAAAKDAKVFGVTSARPGEGKSTIASNLAASIAQTGRQVILIDGDMRRPQVQKVFGLTNEYGLADVLTDKVELKDAIVAGEVNNLSLIHAGRIPSNPAELLDSANFKHMLQTLRDQFEVILIDCPPVLPVADPAIVAPQTDGMIVTVKVDANSRPQSIRVRDILDGVHANILGVVVNRSESSAKKYSYSAYGYESHQHAKEYYRSDKADVS